MLPRCGAPRRGGRAAGTPPPARPPTRHPCPQRHEGARVAGEWSRFDLTTDPKRHARSAVPALAAGLPPAARALYFRDEIGNISSSGARAAGA